MEVAFVDKKQTKHLEKVVFVYKKELNKLIIANNMNEGLYLFILHSFLGQAT